MAASLAILARSSDVDPNGLARSATRSRRTRRAQQHDGVEAIVEPALVRDAAGDEQPARAVAVKERADPVKVPDRLGSVASLNLDDPARIVGVNDSMPAAGKLGERG